MSLQQSADGEQRVIWFGAQDPSCVRPVPLSLGADASAEALANQIGDMFGEELGPQARVLLTHVLATVQAASSPQDRATLDQAYRMLTDAEVRAALVGRAMVSGRLPAATRAYWSHKVECPSV